MPEWLTFLFALLLLHSSRKENITDAIDSSSLIADVEEGFDVGMSGPAMGRWMPGPYNVSTLEAVLDLPEEGSARRVMEGETMTVYVTYPTSSVAVDEKESVKTAMPVLIFYNGFQGRAMWYSSMIRNMASWGYVCLQYNLPPMSLVTVSEEEELFTVMNKWIQNGGLADELDRSIAIDYPMGYVDGSRLVVGGHSRGGKLAGLLYADNEDVKAAWLMDPIDTSQYSPVSPENPSAVLALKKSRKKIGVAGASILSDCNPTQGNYNKFFDAGAAGSWKVVMNETSHSQFSDAGAVTNALQDGLCGKGTASRQYVSDTMATCMLSWFWENLNATSGGAGQGDTDALAPPWNPIPRFFEWIKVQSKQDRLEFEVKV